MSQPIQTTLATAEEEASRKKAQAEVAVPDPEEDEAEKLLKANEVAKSLWQDCVYKFVATSNHTESITHHGTPKIWH